MLELSFSDWMDAIQALAALVVVVSVLWAIRDHRVAQGHLNFEIIQSCMTRFQATIGDIDLNTNHIPQKLDFIVDESRRSAVKRYIDLCSEELFYFEMGYMADPIVDEWIDGMLSYLPLFDMDNKIVFPEYKLMRLLDDNAMDDYPRVTEAFRVRRRDDLKDNELWSDYISQIKRNVKGKKRMNPFRPKRP